MAITSAEKPHTAPEQELALTELQFTPSELQYAAAE